MSERPFMQLYVSDFIGDTLSLSTEQIGAYLMLLMAMWNAKGSLPNDDAKLARIARVSLKKWKSISAEVMAFFDVRDGEIYSRHVEKWRRDRVRLLGRAPLPASLRTAILDRDGEVCRYCGGTEGPFHVDHILPVARGGTDDPENLGIACKACNLSKGAKLLEEWK